MAQPQRPGRPPREIRGGQLFCEAHQAWEDVSKFGIERVSRGTGAPTYSRSCKLAEREAVDQQIAENPGLHVVKGLAKRTARKLGKYWGNTVSMAWVWDELNFCWWPPVLNLMLLTKEIPCLNCGRPINRDALHFDHVQPPRNDGDLARLHARNLQVLHEGENLSKGPSEYVAWLDDAHHRWAIARKWHDKAGRNGWPAAEHLGVETFIDPEPRWVQTSLFPAAGF